MGNAYLLNGDYIKAYEEFEDAVRLGLPGLNPHAALASMAGQGCIQFIRGRLYEAHDTFERVVNTCVRHTDSLMSTLSLAYAFQAEVLYEWNDLEGAERVVNEGLELGKAWGYVGVLAYSYARLSSIKQAQGESREALALLEQGIRVVEGFDMEQYKALMGARYARACLDIGRLDDARRWAETLEICDDLSSQYPRDVEYLTWIRVRIAEGRLDDADSVLARLLPCFEEAEAILSLVEGLCMRALLAQRQRDDKGAEQMLERALILGETGGLIRIFVDQGSDIHSLLRQMANEGQMSAYVNRLLAACCAGDVDENGLLSERELDVLRLIAAGRSNQHIAGDLVVALSTVKTHLNNIYAKLGVHSRTQAVARAKELMLL
ncbi:hypothetical protein KSX_31000 [Ktedonospora formicarum]|uniref:HTH luxR-type domain-containing protein n=2 Tax=Ktedonospora formicarum TaxID=2778364 RepID=A0A8J3MQI1_9CHLR|nr:hypothetical protein KSX_31000 [Ktedonospora formicarum]